VSTFLAVVIVVWTVAGYKTGYQLTFAVAVHGALCYEHGWKQDFDRARPIQFFAFYVVPFAIAAMVVAVHLMFQGGK